jgi:hypothetical protein
VDNQSEDRTYEVCKELLIREKIANIEAFQTLQNNNLGGTHKIAFNEAISQSFDFIGIFHGDNQGSVDDLFKVIQQVTSKEIQISSLGSRFSRKSILRGYSAKRILGNLVLNCVYSLVTRRVLTDLGSGLNIFRVSDLAKIEYVNFGDTLTFNYELILELCRKNVPFTYFPITWRDDGQTSNARNLNIFANGISIALRHRMRIQRSNVIQGKIYNLRWNE